jgi:hypothetical protein
MIGVSDAAPPRAVNQPELAVDELSQICEGLARQRPEICRRCSMRWR